MIKEKHLEVDSFGGCTALSQWWPQKRADKYQCKILMSHRQPQHNLERTKRNSRKNDSKNPKRKKFVCTHNGLKTDKRNTKIRKISSSPVIVKLNINMNQKKRAKN